MGTIQFHIKGGISIAGLLPVEHVHLHLVVVALKEKLVINPHVGVYSLLSAVKKN